jgi:hypothetical protein
MKKLALVLVMCAVIAPPALAARHTGGGQACGSLRAKADRRLMVCVMNRPKSFRFSGTVARGSRIIWKLTCTSQGVRFFSFVTPGRFAVSVSINHTPVNTKTSLADDESLAGLVMKNQPHCVLNVTAANGLNLLEKMRGARLTWQSR